MTIHEKITDVSVNPNTVPENITHTPLNIILPQKLPQRDNNVWLSSPVKVPSQ